MFVLGAHKNGSCYGISACKFTFGALLFDFVQVLQVVDQRGCGIMERQLVVTVVFLASQARHLGTVLFVLCIVVPHPTLSGRHVKERKSTPAGPKTEIFSKAKIE